MSKDEFTSANSMPFKVLKDEDVFKDVAINKEINPIHLQVCPTNKCNLSCSFCSCNSRERGDELPYSHLEEIVDISSKLGVKAFTITGGGEPTLHPHINEFIEYAYSKNIDLGLVSNGLKLTNLYPSTIPKLTWIRVSFEDSRKFKGTFKDNMDYLVEKSEGEVDLAFSYVVTKDYNIDNITSIIQYANDNNFTHVRLVPDLYDTGNIDLGGLEKKLKGKIDLDLCIFQDRSKYTKGMEKCGISLLKPLIAPDGSVYPCCGVQYALPDKKRQRMFPREMRMGHFRNLPEIIDEQQIFDGSVCVKCYYENYNVLLKGMSEDYKHQNFL